MKELKHLKTFESFSQEDILDEGWFNKTPEEKVEAFMKNAMEHLIAWKKQGYVVDMEQIKKDAMADNCKGNVGLVGNKVIGYIPAGLGKSGSEIAPFGG